MSDNISISSEEKVNFITNDINNFLILKKQVEDNMFVFIKYYLTILMGLFAYTGYMEKLVIDNNGNYTKTLEILSYIGLGYIIFVIITGYFLSYGISHMIKKRILYNKEIVSLRKIINDKFLNKCYTDKIIFPINIKNVYNKHFKNLPTIMILINLAVPFISYYYLNIINHEYALNITFCISLLTLIFIPHLCIVHEKELKIAEMISPTKNEEKARAQITKFLTEVKNKIPIKKSDKLLKYLIILFVLINLIKFSTYAPISNLFIFLLMLFILFIRYINIQMRISNTNNPIYKIIIKILSNKIINKIYNLIPTK